MNNDEEPERRRGQVSVSQELRRRLGLSAGDGVEFVRPFRSEVNPFEKYRGDLKSFRSQKEIDAWIREMRG